MVADWASMLSLGEQQRLSIARILIANPSLVLLDESTSALDAANEARLYGALIKRRLSLVSVGHRDSLRQYHDTLLTFDGGDSGTWSLKALGGDADSPQVAVKPGRERSKNV
jgi:putative ATP-binding cassette transporter